MGASGAEAAAAFGDATIFLEKYVSPTRHIEVQVMADAYGNVRTFGERECSIQRRNQKLVEEAPAVAVTPELREQLCAAAAAAAVSCGYQNAGTAEFIVDPDGNFYFLEMNARLQVEHPVTELVYGVDLVALQLAIADGASLADMPAPHEARGWAIECRINGEDPYANFVPSFGRIECVQPPTGPGVRFDTMLFDGLEIPVFYDSLLGKLIVWAETRELAVLRMRRALQDLLIVGVETNAAFHRALMDDPRFRSGDFHTGWLEREFHMPSHPDGDPRERDALIAAAIAARVLGGSPAASPASGPDAGRWQRSARARAVDMRTEGGGARGWRRGIAFS
jgi:acetyl-CoA carboxylase biotin carboxylase subunit